VSTPAGAAVDLPDRVIRHQVSGEDAIRWSLVAVFAVVLGLFLLYPLSQVLWRGLLGSDGRFIGAANYGRYFPTPATAPSPPTRLLVPALSMVATVTLALGYAYALTRTFMPARGLLRVAAMLPLFAPSLVQALGLIYVFGNNGLITRTTGFNVG